MHTSRSRWFSRPVTWLIEFLRGMPVLFKDSSLGFIVGYPEVLPTMQLNDSFFGDKYRFPLFVVVLIIYLAVNITLTRVAVFVERRLAARGQGGRVVTTVLPPEVEPAPGERI